MCDGTDDPRRPHGTAQGAPEYGYILTSQASQQFMHDPATRSTRGTSLAVARGHGIALRRQQELFVAAANATATGQQAGRAKGFQCLGDG